MSCTKANFDECNQKCLVMGYCKNRHTPLVTDAELANPEFIRDLRATAYAEHVDAECWQDHVSDLYRDYAGWVSNDDEEADKEVLLNMDVFELPSIREWFRDFCCTPCPVDVTPRVRVEAWERVRVLATILRATYPVRASLWGVHPANNNHPPAQ